MSNGLESAQLQISKEISLTQYVTNVHKEAPSPLEMPALFVAIQAATKYISAKCLHAGLSGLLGEEGSTNIQGETVKKFDILSNDAFVTALTRCGVVSAMISEENEKPIYVRDGNGHFLVCFDPLDGSSNIDVNISVGTIFAVYRIAKSAATLTDADLLLSGRHLVASGYCAYGSATVMVLACAHDRAVNAFTLDQTTGEFLLSHAAMKVPSFKTIYSCNQGNYGKWSDDVRGYFDSVCQPEEGEKSFSLRYVGSMVADVHRTLIYGGLFAYPADFKSTTGKLRLLYEANPMSFIMECAGGRAIYAKGKPVLDIVPKTFHERSPIFLGSKKNIDQVEKYIK